MDPFTHFIGRVESTRKKLCFVIPYNPKLSFKKRLTFGYNTNHENLYFSLALRDKGLTFFKK